MTEKDTSQIEITRREHDDSLGIPGKRVFPWGFDGVNAQPLAVDELGQMKVSGTITGGVTTVFQGGNWNLASTATIYAVVNTAAAGQASIVLDTGTKQIGSVTISHPITIQGFSGPTIYAVVNTAAAGQASIVLDAGIRQIGSVTVSNVVNSITTINPRTDYIGLVSVSGNVNLMIGGTAVGPANPVAIQPPVSGYLPVSSVAGTAQIGSVTVSNVVNSLTTISNVINGIVTITPRTDYLGLVSVSGNVAVSSIPALSAGTAQIGSVTISNPLTINSISSMATIYAIVNTGAVGDTNALATLLAGPNQIGSVTISHPVVLSGFSGPTIYAVVNTAAAGQASVVLDTGTKFIGIVTIANQPALVAGTAFVGLVTVAPHALTAGTAQIGSVTIANMRPLVAGTTQIGSVTVSSIGPGTATIGIVRLPVKVWKTAPIALSATNLSGATILVSAASLKYYITSLMLSNSSVVGISMLNGPTYLAGNASVRMQLAAQSGIVNSGGPENPIIFGQAAQTNFLIATDTAAPISGNIVWYEE